MLREKHTSAARVKSGTKRVWLVLALIVISAFAFAESGTLNLVYSNGVTTYTEEKTVYDFDVQVWMSGGSDVIGDGMAYVAYPTEVFGSSTVLNGKVSVEKTGILAGVDPLMGIDLYSLVNVTDTRGDVFAVTFTSAFNGNLPSFKSYYTAVSTDPENPSDLLHVTMEAAVAGQGTLSFPAYIPGIDMLYYDYESELFSGGLLISEAFEPVEVIANEPEPPAEDPVVNEEGYIELASFQASLKKTTVTLTWETLAETDMAGFIIKCSVNGGLPVEIAGYESDLSLQAAGTSSEAVSYDYVDSGLLSGNTYAYQLLSVDVYGNAIVLHEETVQIASKPGGGKKKVIVTESFSQDASYPNPFNPSFVVPFELISAQTIDIKLYDMSGKVVNDIAGGRYQAGSYNIQVNCDHLGSGIYLLKTRVNGESSTQKMLLVK
ncbi:MAG: T9SS type A sorting domain-containing protein [Candidatus Marinimicrobia bacterium]|nr:T9SS type A sorting domain-containing protein [Candidatus Neomarinimicrobiota bacterium]